MLRQIWTDFIAPILRRPSRFQVAALCWREAETGIEVLLISSRETKRWILPKGWPKAGRDSAGTALEEAWEEAGIVEIEPRPERIGQYSYHKRLEGGVPVHTLVDVYAIHVSQLADAFPEAGQRERAWFPPEQAATLVQEPDLAALLRTCPGLITAPS
ncbi:NUDIX hydrolase [Falsirhodobacter algicola]|uniref:NUDIX domain-containing protein n=1 Tax=Falsirhodobacter algicola TaxID=2692330 RepID=A0A8J8MTT6_9RHOB|nr:NUDIX hydrolase [Falsirhodobacter algicola]QUS36354.1 NUDIX domain-containing protein [Falsirhodobacter algicola]